MRNSKSIAELAEQGNDPLKYVGMWCDNRHPSADRTPAVVLMGMMGELCCLSHPDLNGRYQFFLMNDVVPRFDVPPAWPSEEMPEVHRRMGSHR